ncbi:MAG TPA: hypothetical protein VGZ02_08785 [Candidatus Baltobacteraceae bacterium]|jgi:hypothetical protein|nr:hypothetical protein [Candidatus Baltobacteraceae bacterium]
MVDVFELARRSGVRIEYADLGAWGSCELRSEYDPHDAVIRVNTRLLQALPPAQALRVAALAVAHELYHHREACGEVPRLRDRVRREDAADAFARSLLQT